MKPEEIPIIDVSALESGDGTALQRVADKLCSAAQTVGFFYIENHGVSQLLIEEALTLARQFFNATEEEKRAVAISPFHRGWLRRGEAQMYGNQEPDFKESFVWGLDIEEDDSDFRVGGRLLAPNQWPGFMPDMRGKLVTYFQEAQICGQRLLKAFAMGLDIDPEFFLKDFNKPVSRGSLICYPPQKSPSVAHFGSGAHTDYGTLTLLYQDEVGGLQIKGKSGAWLSATPIKGTYVVNIGDLLARWSNDRFESTPHRVVSSTNRTRYSLAMFVDPNWDAAVEPVTIAGEDSKYEPVRCADYINERYNEAFAYRNTKVSSDGNFGGDKIVPGETPEGVQLRPMPIKELSHKENSNPENAINPKITLIDT